MLGEERLWLRVASVGQRIDGKALQTFLRAVGAGGNPSSGQRGATAWYPPRDGCWARRKADPGNKRSKARIPIVVVSLSRASVYFNENVFSVKFVTYHSEMKLGHELQ